MLWLNKYISLILVKINLLQNFGTVKKESKEMKKKTAKKNYETPKLKKLGDVKKITLKTGSTTDFGEQGFV
jgi:hypothetical protein